MTEKKICGNLDQEFLDDKNIYKYAMLWASQFYVHINHIMRTHEADEIIGGFPCTLYFIKNYIRYFYKYGVTKDQLERHVALYRGMKGDFEIVAEYSENGFMSTTYDKKVAKSFAHDDGNVLCFRVKDLPDDAPMIVINEEISDYLHEDEVLLLPGSIRIKAFDKSKNILLALYTMNQSMVDQYLNAKTPIPTWVEQKGGAESKLIKELQEQQRMGGKWLFFYRCILGRQPEILGQLRVPTGETKIRKFFRYNYRGFISKYESIMNLMTEVQDIKEFIKAHKESLSKEEKMILWKKMWSYNTYVAVYNPVTEEVESLYYGYPDVIVSELGGDVTYPTELLRSMIWEHCSWLRS